MRNLGPFLCISFWTAVGWTWRKEMAFCSISQAYSIGFKSVDLVGQSVRTINSSSRYRFLMWALCEQALSSIRMKSGSTARTWTSKILLMCLTAVSVPFSIMCRSVFSLSAYSRPHYYEPPPKRSCSATHAGAKRLFGLFQTLARLSVNSTQNLVSSVNRTGIQSLTFHVIWVCAHCKRSLIWRCVKDMRIAGLRDLNPASCNLFLTVFVLTRTPVAFWKSLRKVVAFENRWRLA
jgi:hypothetical protein